MIEELHEYLERRGWSEEVATAVSCAYIEMGECEWEKELRNVINEGSVGPVIRDVNAWRKKVGEDGPIS